MNTNPKLAEIDKKIALVSIVSMPAPLLVGFGLLGRYGSPDKIPFEFLTNNTVVNIMLAVGAAFWIWTGYAVFKLAMEKVNLQSETKP